MDAADAPPAAAWSFVQMNMSLLPIARPLPVAAACPRRLRSEALESRKPRTPTQKLHRRVLQSAANISPRRHDLHSSTSNSTSNSNSGVRRLSNASLLAAAASFCPPPIDPRAPSASPPARVRCQSEELRRKRHVDGDGDGDGASGYASDSSDGAARPASARAYKGKRLLELLDEERRMCPDERAAQQSPSKRSRLQR